MQSPAFVLGYHGCDESVGEAILDGHKTIELSTNEHDWLGTGAYFWEGDSLRAQKWAEYVRDNPQSFKQKIITPFVLGAIIEPGECLDLHNSGCLSEVKDAYEILNEMWSNDPAIVRPENERAHSRDSDFVKRKLDCYVINSVHRLGKTVFDTVRGGFPEGGPLYPGGLIMERTHIQICVRDPGKSIRGYFRPKEYPRRTAQFSEEQQTEIRRAMEDLMESNRLKS
jgi:hypothetical protein